MRILVLLGVLLSGCSFNIKPTQAEIVSDKLIEQISRIEPMLSWCDGGVAKAQPNNNDGRPNCDTGDSMLFTGSVLSVPWYNQGNMFSAIRNSVAESGQPFRAPSYLNNDDLDAFSRDQLIGLVHYLITSKDTELATRVIRYIKANNNRLCPKASDNRCVMTLSTMALVDDVSQYLGLGSAYNVSRYLDEQATIIEAETSPIGYQKNLIAMKVYAKIRMGKLTKNYAKAVQIITKKQPNNLFFQFLYNFTSTNDKALYENIAHNLSYCMEQWNNPGVTWAFEVKRDVVCESRAMGHEYVWLAKLLTGPKQLISWID